MTIDPPPFILHRGTCPLLVSVPHTGTFIPDALNARLTDAARTLPDTDWHVDRLYVFAREMGASMLVATPVRFRPPPPHEEIYLHADDSVSAVRIGVGRYLAVYKGRRPNTALSNRAPDEATSSKKNLKNPA